MKLKASSNGVKKHHVKVQPAKAVVYSNGESDASGLQKLFINELRICYSAEKLMVRHFPKLIALLESAELREEVENHLAESRQQVERLEKIFSEMSLLRGAKRNSSFELMLTETLRGLAGIKKGPVRDAAAIMAFQRMEHIEIANYGTLYAFTQLLNEVRVGAEINACLQEEKRFDLKLTEIAASYINLEAMTSWDFKNED